MTYKNPKALDRDVDSISAIMRLREEKYYPAIEECKALFVTTNYDLARISRQFYYKESDFHTVCPCLTDGVLTNLLWLKKPTKAPDLPRKRIIADCYAATQPSEHLWNLYLTEIDKLEQDKQVTPDEYYSLRHSLEAKSALMELTYGEEEGFTRGTVQEILELVRSRMQAEVKAKLEYEKKLREETEQKLAEVQKFDEQVRSELESEKKRSAEAEEKLEEVLAAKAELLDTVKTVEAGVYNILCKVPPCDIIVKQ